MASEGGATASQVPVPDNTPEEEFDLFGPDPVSAPENPFATPPVATAKASPAGSPVGSQGGPVPAFQQAAFGTATAGAPVPPSSGAGGDFQSIMLEMLRQQNQTTMEMLRQQSLAMQQNQQMCAAMLRRMDLEEKRRNEADDKAAETARIAAEAALKAKTVDPFVPAPPSSSSSAPTVTAPYTPSVPQNRAEKYLPNLPMIDHQGMSKGRMREVECWHSFLETLSSWLALQDEAYVRELQYCIKTKHEIDQASLAADVAARSAKLFYYLTQSLSKWERGLELLRSCSKRQSQSATGYEVVRTINAQYSIVSRMEAVVVREHCLKLHQECKNIRQPTDVIRHLEDEFSRAESKLTNFAELKLSEADKCSVLLQALGPEVRQYVLLHGSSSDWKALTKSLTYYEEQLRLCEIPSNNRALNTELLCDHCGKRGHLQKDCWKWKREQKKNDVPKGKGKGDKGSGKGKDPPKGKGDQPKGHPDKGKGKGKEKGKGKKKKGGGKGKHRSIDGEESEPESEGGSTVKSQSVMAMRLGSWTLSRPDRALSPFGGREGPSEKPEKAPDSVSQKTPDTSKFEAALICLFAARCGP